MRVSILLASLLLVALYTWTEADHASVITEDDIAQLRDIHRIFQQYFNRFKRYSHQRQYAVLYYGYSFPRAIIDQRELKSCLKQTRHIFIERPVRNFCVRRCSFIASKQHDNRQRHTEDVIFRTIPNVCPQAKGRNIYLFTYLSPCRNCAELIANFVKRCGNNFKRLIVGYKVPYNDVKLSTEYIEETYKVAVTRI